MNMRIAAVVGPSGAGKDTLIQRALDRRPDLRLVRRVITRPTEAGGEDFDGVTPAIFWRMRDQGHFVLHWQAHGLSYGIPRAALVAAPMLVNLSRGILPEAARLFPGLQVIHVDADPAIRAQRLAARGRESATAVTARIAREVPFNPGKLPVIHVNNSGDVDAATTAFLAALDEVPTP